MNQLPIDFAHALRDEGMARALDHAETDCPGWSDTAMAFLKRYAEEHAEFTAFMVTAASELDRSFPLVSNPRAWGQVYRQAMKMGVIEKTDRFMPHPRRHACPAMVFSSLVYRA